MVRDDGAGDDNPATSSCGTGWLGKVGDGS